MERVIALLKEKNHYLDKFHWLNEQELINFGDGNFDNVEAFYQARDKILDLVKKIDSLIDEESLRPGAASDSSREQRLEFEAMMKAKDEVVKSIVGQDLQILAYIEKEKSNIIRELRSTTQAKKAVAGYGATERIQTLDDMK